jgi:hypothetical protein
MPAIPPGWANATWVIQRTGDLEPYSTSLGLELGAGGFSVVDAIALTDAIETTTRANLSSGETWVRMDYAYNEGDGVQEYSDDVNLVGTGSPLSATTSQNVSALIQKGTQRPGRQGRGRMYWPTVFEAEVDGVGAIAPALRTRLTAMLSAFTAAVTAAEGFVWPVVLHSTTGQGDPDRVTSLTVSGLVATQRRRLRK